MEYFLRQIETGNPDPLIINLKSDDVVVGSDIYPVLAKYPRVLPQHAQFVRQFRKWYVKSMQSSEKIYVNGFPLVTHRLKEIQIGDHVAFGSEDNQKRFVCCLSAKASCKLLNIEVIDISTDNSPATEIGSINKDRTIKNESSDNIIPVMECDQVEVRGERNEQMIKSPIGENVSQHICPPTVKSEHTSDSLPFKRNEPMDWNPATVKSEFEYICPPTVKRVQVNDSLFSVNRDPMDKTLPAVKRELDYSCPPTVKNDYMDDLPLVTESDPMDKSLPTAENLLDYSCPPTVRNDFVPFIKDEPLDSSLPTIRNESLDNRHFITKKEHVNIYSSVIKSEPMNTNPPVIKSEPMDNTYPYRKTKPVNTVPPVSNEFMCNIFPAVKSEPVDRINENSTFSYNFTPSASQLDAVSVNQIAASSAEEEKNTSKQFQSTSSSRSAINNQDFYEKRASSISVTASGSSETTENFIRTSKDFSSTSSIQNVQVNTVSVESKNYSTNSGYSEIEDVITISDDEAYLDYGSCKTIKQEYLDDDFNINYHDIKGVEVNDENDMNLHHLLFGDDSTVSSINESIKELEESAKKMLDDDSGSKTSQEYPSFSGNISQDHHNADADGESSNSSVSSHEDIIIPFAKKTKSDSSSTANRKSENAIEITAPFSKKENQGTTNIKKPYSTFENQLLKRTLPTEPKPLSNSTKKIRKPEEHKKDFEQIKKKIPEKSKSASILSRRKALAKSKNGSALSSRKALTSSFEDKRAVSKKLVKSPNKKPQPSKQSTGKNMQKSSKISNGVVVTEKLEFKIPKVTKSSSSDMNIAPSASEKINLETAHQTKGSTLDKKTPTIARKPNKWASRSAFLITDFNTEKPKSIKKISAVSKTNIKANKLTNSTKMSSSADGEINKIGKRTVTELNSPNVITGLKSSKMSSSAGREINGPQLNSANVITGLKNSKMSSSADREVNKTGKESGPELNSSNVVTGLKNSKMSSSADRQIHETGKETVSKPNSLNVINSMSSPIPVLISPPNLENSSIPVIVSSNRRKDRKSLNEDRNFSKTATIINRSISHNQTLLGLLNKQFHGDQEVNFENDAMNSSDKSETPVISENNFQLSKEQNISKQHFQIGAAGTSTKSSGNTQWQHFHKDQGLNFRSDPMHTFDKNKTPVISENNFHLNTDKIVVSKQLPFSVTSTSNNARNVLQKPNTSVFAANHHNETTKLHTNLSDKKNFIIKTVVEWTERWFKEYETMRKPHPNLTDGVLHLPLYFNSLDDYISSFIRLLLLEIWEKVSIEYKPIWKEEKRVTNKFYFIVTSAEIKWDLTEYKCEALINHLSFEPKAGNLVVLYIQDKKTENINPVLGYIKSYRILSNNNTNPELLTVYQSWIKDAKLCCFSVLVKIRKYLYPVFNKIMRGNGLFCLSSYLKLVEASYDLEYSPLCPSILKPELTTFFSNYPDVPSTSTFSKAQMSIIHGISPEIEKQVSEPKLFLIQGAPGTGKTRIILGLLENLIFSCRSKQKILIVAPSSVAIDEIGSRLIELNERSRSWRSHVGIRFVRVNLFGKTSEKMRQFSLDEMYREYKIKSKMERLENIDMQIQTLIKSNDPSDQEELKSLIEQRKELRNQIEFMQSDEKARLDYYHYVLLESQVILTTVSCCSSPLLQEFCKRNSNLIFSCCIIDEVTQCTELEFLQVISLGINKLILVGDHLGLPAVVHSKAAENLGFGRSAFERFLQYFSHSQQESPVVELLEQHRMHSDICYFPSYYFYSSQLSTADGTDSRYEQFLAVSSEKTLAPYTVFYIQKYGTQKLCVDSVMKLCIQSVTYKPSVSVGIIVPSRELHDAFTTWVAILKKNHSKYEVIEVGTVENFQGQEKDIVFLCCFYDGDSSSFLSNSRKLNVALTRARKCLVLCIFPTARKLEDDWVNLIVDAQNRHCCYFITKTKEMSLVLR